MPRSNSNSGRHADPTLVKFKVLIGGTLVRRRLNKGTLEFGDFYCLGHGGVIAVVIDSDGLGLILLKKAAAEH
jgi:hypothetical protein